jgi:hypothetical protein
VRSVPSARQKALLRGGGARTPPVTGALARARDAAAAVRETGK